MAHEATAVAVLTLTLGIGSNTAIYSLIDSAMLRKLPVRNPQELVQLTTRGPYGVSSFSYPGFKRFRDENHVFSGLLAIGWLAGLDSTVNGQAESVQGRIVYGNFFSLLGVNPVMGRTFSSEDDETPRGSPVAVISYSYWELRFGLDASAVGKSIPSVGPVFQPARHGNRAEGRPYKPNKGAVLQWHAKMREGNKLQGG